MWLGCGRCRLVVGSVVTGPLLAASVSGAPAWIIWQVSREALAHRIRQLGVTLMCIGMWFADFGVRLLIREAARQYRELVDGSRSEAADSVECRGAGLMQA